MTKLHLKILKSIPGLAGGGWGCEGRVEEGGVGMDVLVIRI